MVKPKLELTEADARRLAFAQHLIMRAHEDARLPSALNAAAVLSAQDAVEMVLIVISQALDLDPNKYQFMAFWEAFAKRGLELPYKESMRRLNDCRVAIKHRGSFPSSFDIERVVADAEAFVGDSIACAYGADRAVEGLFGFITYEGVREHLRKAKVHLEEHERTASVEESALAFDELLNEYWGTRYMGPGSSFSFNKFGRFDAASSWVPGGYGFKDLRNHVDKTVKTARKPRPLNVQVFPSTGSLARLAGAVMCEQDEMWQESRYFSEARMNELYDDGRTRGIDGPVEWARLEAEARKMLESGLKLADRAEAA